MAIHPRHATAILDGCKRVEYRKRPLAADVHTVFVYATAPVSAIVGEFDVAANVMAPPAELWQLTGSEGGITATEFDSYFAGHDRAVAIRVAQTHRYDQPVRLADLEPPPATPQSFSYLPAELGALVRQAGGQRPHIAIQMAGAMWRRVLGLIPQRARAVAPVAMLPPLDAEPPPAPRQAVG